MLPPSTCLGPMFFTPLTSKAPGVLQSTPVSVVSETSLRVASVVGGVDTYFLINGVNSGLETIAHPGDIVQLVSTLSSENTAALFQVFVNGVEEFTFFSTFSVSEYPYKFHFVDSLPQLPGSYESSSFQLYRLKGSSVLVQVPNAYSATILKNGVDQGQSCYCSNDDVVSILVTIPDITNWTLSLPVSVGGYVDTLDVWRAYQDQVVDDIQFTAQTGVSTGALCTSNTVNVTGIDVPVLAKTSAKLFINGVERTSPSMVSPGDSLYLQITASNKSDTATHTVLWLGDRYFDFVVVTASATLYVTDDFLGKDIFDIAFSPDNSSNRVVSFNATGLIDTFSLSTVHPSSLGSNQILVASYWEDRIYIVDPGLGLQDIVYLPAGSHPHSIATLPSSDAFGSPHVHFVSLSGSNSLLELDVETYQPRNYFHLGSGYSPKGLDVDDDAFIYIATSQGTLCFDYLSESFVQVDATPSTDVCSVGPRVFVTCLAANLVQEFNKGALVRTFSTGLNPYGMTVIDQELYVCNSADNTVTCFDLTSNTITKNFPTNSYPVFCSSYQGLLSVVHHGSKDLTLLDITTGLYSTVALNGFPYGVSNHFVCLLYSNTPNRVSDVDFTPSTPSVVYDAPLESSVAFPLQGSASRTLHVAIPERIGASLLVNGVEHGSDVYVRPGQSISVSISTGSVFSTTYTVLVSVNNAVVPLVAVTSFDSIPDFMEFGGIYNVFRRTFVTSISKTIAGVSEGHVTAITYTDPYDDASIIVNGVSKGKTAVVAPGDSIELSSKVMGICGEVTPYHLTSGGSVVGNFEIGTYAVEGPIKDLINPQVAFDSSSSDFVKADVSDPTFLASNKDASKGVFETILCQTPSPQIVRTRACSGSLNSPSYLGSKTTFGSTSVASREFHKPLAGDTPNPALMRLSILGQGVTPSPEPRLEASVSTFSALTGTSVASTLQTGVMPIGLVDNEIFQYLTEAGSCVRFETHSMSFGTPTATYHFTAKLADPRPITPIFERITYGTFSPTPLLDKFEKVRLKSFDPFPFTKEITPYRVQEAIYVKDVSISDRMFTFNYMRGVLDSDRPFSMGFGKDVDVSQHFFTFDFSKSSSNSMFNTQIFTKDLTFTHSFTSTPTLGPKIHRDGPSILGAKGAESRQAKVAATFTHPVTHVAFAFTNSVKQVDPSHHIASASYTRFVEKPFFDPNPQRGLYTTEADALTASGDDPLAIIYTYQGKYTFRTTPDSSIVCLRPISKVVKKAGWIQGG